jgi:hypothetical protein
VARAATALVAHSQLLYSIIRGMPWGVVSICSVQQHAVASDTFMMMQGCRALLASS